MPLAENHEALVRLCRQFQVKRLDLFGSATRDDFRPDYSDLDFVVSFLVQNPAEYTRRYFGLARGLEELFQRPVDLITEASIRNLYFRQSVDESRQLIYAN